MNNGIDL